MQVKDMAKRWYLFNSPIGVDEDEAHEFKSHRTLSLDEMPPWTTVVNERTGQLLRSRQPISKTIVGFLNTGRGGVCYLGVQNDGIVKGLKLTNYQKDHIIVSLYDVLSRYSPKVDSNQVRVEFVPALTESTKGIPEEAQEYYHVDIADDRRWKKTHSMRTPNYCWCDKDALGRYNMGLLPMSYVIEITVKPWDGVTHQRLSNVQVPPIYRNERGLAYIRRLASNIQIGIEEANEMTENQIHNYYGKELENLEQELEKLQKMVTAKFKLTKMDEIGKVVQNSDLDGKMKIG